MHNKIYYPNIEKVIEINALALTIIKIKKADEAKLLSFHKLSILLEECEKHSGDVYDKAVILLKELIQKHVFASGNRRTAFLVTKYFLQQNNHLFRIKDEPKHARVMLGIREGYYSDEEIKEWIINGKIREFKR